MADTAALSIAETIRQSLARLTPTERRPALALLANYPVPGLEPVAQFARRSGVSGPTILRLVAKLGFPSYPDFQKALRDELELRLQTPLAKAARPDRRSPAPARDFIDSYGRAMIANVERSLAEVPRPVFEAAVELLADRRRRVLLMGGRFTGSVALQFYLHLRELRPRVQLVSGQTATWVEHLLDIGRQDLLVVYDIRRYQEDVVRFARQAAGLGASVILFTDQWLSPIAAIARHVFALRTSMPSSWESFAALSALTEAMVVRIHERRWGEAKQRMERLETMRGRLNPQ
ncbi:MAG TPA: MurR/RpiR family transcriptional regulator [Acidocella sp.]|nr:MurR/RpiR family transcriptional regulator [Acidocella sp.]